MDWLRQKYVGLMLDWDYDNKQIHLSMPGYIKVVLIWFQHPLLETHKINLIPYPTKLWSKTAIPNSS